MTKPSNTPPALRKRLLGLRENWADFRIRTAPSQNVPPPFPEDDSMQSPTYIVLSKDRPMQLDACLRSVQRFAPPPDAIVIIYKASTKQFAEGYAKLACNTPARFLAESSDFRRDVLTALDAATQHTAFLMDDDVFFRAPPHAALPTVDFAALSLRLGINTTYCYALDRDQPIPEFESHSPYIAWNWTRAQDDFAYPMSIDGSIFRTAFLRRLLRRARFTNPGELEEELHLRRHLAPAWMLSFRESCLVSIPANVVSSTHRNRAGTQAVMSAAALNARFLRGERINLDDMNFASVRSAHQEAQFAFDRSGPKP